jgi:hypothetical protein
MPTDMTRYGPDWKQFSATIRIGRAAGRCECTGQCGMHLPNPDLRRCSETHATKARWFKGKVILTVAHLCKCNPPCQNPSHVIAACQRCHLRIDSWEKARKRHQHPRHGDIRYLGSPFSPSSTGLYYHLQDILA